MINKLSDHKFHFVGVGGIGMCGLAELLHNMGAKVSGSDLASNANTERLKNLGVVVHVGHDGKNVEDVDVVVYSSAVKDSNPEIQSAKKNKIPLIPRAEALAEIMRLKRGVAVAGTHGKTTTTSMATSIFIEGKTDPTVVIGGRLDLINSTALLGRGEWLLAEADESDGSFQKLSPEIGIITNIDSDHMDHFKTFENLRQAFYGFAQKIPFYGVLIACGDDPTIREVFAQFEKKILFYGFESHNDYRISGANGKYQLFEGEKKLGEFEVRIPGRHSALNATAALLAGLNAGIDFSTCVAGLYRFQGVDRRFQLKGEASGVTIYDDYGHHPTEVKAVLQAFREKYPKRRLVIYFQPHRYSRTQHSWKDFTVCFEQSDRLFMTDIYPAGEAPIAGITTENLLKELKHKNATHLPKAADFKTAILKELQAGDVFITLGAGDGWKVGMEILESLKSK